MLLQYQSGHSTLSLKFLHYWVFITFLIWLAAKCTFFFIRKWLHHLVLHGLITQENLSMSRFQCQWDKQQDRKIKIETILLVVLMEPGSLFWLCFQGSLVHSSQFRVRSRGVAVRRGYTTSRCSIRNTHDKSNLLVPLPLKKYLGLQQFESNLVERMVSKTKSMSGVGGVKSQERLQSTFYLIMLQKNNTFVYHRTGGSHSPTCRTIQLEVNRNLPEFITSPSHPRCNRIPYFTHCLSATPQWRLRALCACSASSLLFLNLQIAQIRRHIFLMLFIQYVCF